MPTISSGDSILSPVAKCVFGQADIGGPTTTCTLLLGFSNSAAAHYALDKPVINIESANTCTRAVETCAAPKATE